MTLSLQLDGLGKRGTAGGCCTLRGLGATSIEPNAFKTVAPTLNTLDVANNALTLLGCITELDSLKELRMNDNKLVSAEGLSRYAAAWLRAYFHDANATLRVNASQFTVHVQVQRVASCLAS